MGLFDNLNSNTPQGMFRTMMMANALQQMGGLFDPRRRGQAPAAGAQMPQMFAMMKFMREQQEREKWNKTVAAMPAAQQAIYRGLPATAAMQLYGQSQIQGMKSQAALELERAKRGLGGPFQGENMDAQSMNILLNGDPASPQYLAAYNRMAQPKMQIDPQSGAAYVQHPDMSAYRVPASLGGTGKGPGFRVTTEGVPTRRQSEGQALSQGFAHRMLYANDLLGRFDAEGGSGWGRFLEAVPGGNYLQGTEYQQFQQARDNFINAQLRRESGAAIGVQEYANADKQYFPVPGDGPEVIRQKAINRQLAIDAMVTAAGPAYRAPTGKAGGTVPVKMDGSIDTSGLSKGQVIELRNGRRFRYLGDGKFDEVKP